MTLMPHPDDTMTATRPFEASGLEEIRSGTLVVRLARDAAELDAAQALRFRVFYQEMGAKPDAQALAMRRDSDQFDAIADHLLVIDENIGLGAAGVIGAYRLIQRESADRLGRFYSADEFDIAPLLALPGKLLELGRSCVDSAYRGRSVMQLLWRGIAAYVFHHNIDLMFGCASLPGTDPDKLSEELSYLYHYHLAPPALRPRALESRHVPMHRIDPTTLDQRQIISRLPPLIKGYLRLGGFVGDGAVIDPQFNTTDIAIIVKTDLITEKYYKHYDRQRRDGGDC